MRGQASLLLLHATRNSTSTAPAVSSLQSSLLDCMDFFTVQRAPWMMILLVLNLASALSSCLCFLFMNTLMLPNEPKRYWHIAEFDSINRMWSAGHIKLSESNSSKLQHFHRPGHWVLWFNNTVAVTAVCSCCDCCLSMALRGKGKEGC